MSDNSPKPINSPAKPKIRNRGGRTKKSKNVEPDVFELKKIVQDNLGILALLEQNVQVFNYEKKAFEYFQDFDINKNKVTYISNVLISNIKYYCKSLTLPIQRYAIAPALEGKDVLGCAPTGTGKTLAFLIPILELLLRMKKKGQLERSTSIIQPICLIMAPTRELAIQIDREAKKLIHKTGIKSDYAIGGHDEDRQLNKLSSSRPHILVATPGRLNAFLNKARHGNRINLERIKFIILDEADRMLDMGFKPQIEKMFNVASPALRKQVLMYSATFPEDVKVLAKTYLSNNFAKIIVGPAGAVNKNIY